MDEIENLILRQELTSTEFSREMARLLYSKSRITPELAARVNLKLAKTVFSKWSIEILTILYSVRSASYGDLRRGLKGVSSRVLSEKLKRLEMGGLLRRAIVEGRPPRTTYSLTDDGITVAKLGEPVFLFLGFKEGLYSSPEAPVPRRKW
ncbi:MAG TPA: winged helix-turn-helix transcriptional regulator [Nitrososphaerales archaeon]|nr:winged helix-turn-helix transcriptional regulator [Nitrososphaerales archaeon]